MYADVELAVPNKGKALAVPSSAVISSGTRQVVLVEVGGVANAGRFEPREVKLGTQGDSYVEILSGVGEGEKVVVSANFLIDAESNLRAALGGMGGTAAPQPAAAAPSPTQPVEAHTGH
jgi:Cu(I)/Ag(I) efflux system membrane fusion protein